MPQGKKVDAQFDHVIVPGSEGDFGVYPDHTPFITRLRPGVLQCFNGEKQTRFALHDGFVTVDADVIRIVCEVAESTRDIDVERAKRARERAEDRLKGKQEDTDFRRAEAALHRAVARITASQSDI